MNASQDERIVDEFDGRCAVESYSVGHFQLLYHREGLFEGRILSKFVVLHSFAGHFLLLSCHNVWIVHNEVLLHPCHGLVDVDSKGDLPSDSVVLSDAFEFCWNSIASISSALKSVMLHVSDGNL